MEQIKAFDTGPGNMVIDALVRRFTNAEKTYDANGSIAAGGQVIVPLLEKLLTDPFLQAYVPSAEPEAATLARQLVGFSLAAHGLSDDDSLKLQSTGIGGRRSMGCGIFNPIRKPVDFEGENDAV